MTGNAARKAHLVSFMVSFSSIDGMEYGPRMDGGSLRYLRIDAPDHTDAGAAIAACNGLSPRRCGRTTGRLTTRGIRTRQPSPVCCLSRIPNTNFDTLSSIF